MREYIEKLRDELNSVLERPVTLGRAEEAAKYAEAIQAPEEKLCEYYKHIASRG